MQVHRRFFRRKFYGDLWANRQQLDMWEELNSIATRWPLPWSLGGDVNVIHFPSRKKVGCRLTSKDEKSFGFYQ